MRKGPGKPNVEEVGAGRAEGQRSDQGSQMYKRGRSLPKITIKHSGEVDGSSLFCLQGPCISQS